MWDDMDWGSMVRKVVPRPEPEPAPPAEAAEPEKPVVEARAAVSTPPAPTPPPLPVDEKLAMLPRAEDSAPERAPRNESRGPATVGLSAADRFVYAPQTAATFTFCTPEGVEQGTVVLKSEMKIGRHSGNDIVIQELHVSSHHARIVQRDDGCFELFDLGSGGGTFVNDEQVQQRVLRHGDRVDFATVSGIFRHTAAATGAEDDGIGSTLPYKRVAPGAPMAAAPPPSPAAQHGRLVLAVSGMPRLVMPLAGEVNIGRADTNSLVIPEVHVSGLHARINLRADGVHELQDLLSTCGTYVNGTQVQKHALQPGDRIRFGASVECLFELSSELPPTPRLPVVWDVPSQDAPASAPPVAEVRLPVPKPAK